MQVYFSDATDTLYPDSGKQEVKDQNNHLTVAKVDRWSQSHFGKILAICGGAVAVLGFILLATAVIGLTAGVSLIIAGLTAAIFGLLWYFYSERTEVVKVQCNCACRRNEIANRELSNMGI